MPDSAPAAILSLSDTTGAAALAQAVQRGGVDIYATGGTKAFLERNGIAARGVAELTGHAALFGGLVKTLHPKIFGGILYDRDASEQREEAEKHGIVPVAVVAVTLYPPPEIDIGGVALLRAAAKNYAHVTVLCDPSQYGEFVAALEHGGPSREQRERFAIAALAHTAAYDARNVQRLEGEADTLPDRLALFTPRAQALRYGENPQERAAFYSESSAMVPEQLHGKALSYNNLLDLDATLRLLSRSPLARRDGDDAVRAVVVKHTVPCGAAQRARAADAAREALDADRISAYGGIVAVDARLDREAAEALVGVFLEIVAAPEFADDALAVLRRKRSLRVMRFARTLPGALQSERRLRSALGGILVEEPDPHAEPERLRTVSRREPTEAERRDLIFAWDVVRHVKSNGIVIARDNVTHGICAGQTNRVSAVEIAASRAGENARGAACASDGFFPFADGIEAAIAAGCRAVVAPGGSIRDEEVIAAADRAGIALLFSSHRHFLH
ncbi:MAG TPA: bifunctional phosphoribosylaminoimidazolecarboxamide formyltransferase/IMP cyclohydrolase [Candidatus Tyrphobacter sp.]